MACSPESGKEAANRVVFLLHLLSQELTHPPPLQGMVKAEVSGESSPHFTVTHFSASRRYPSRTGISGRLVLNHLMAEFAALWRVRFFVMALIYVVTCCIEFELPYSWC